MLWFAQGSAGLFLMVADLRTHERQAAEELGQWKTRVEAQASRRVAGSDHAGHGLEPVVCSRVRQLQEALSAAAIALEISSRNVRVAALQKR
jgi:hypothetical protein